MTTTKVDFTSQEEGKFIDSPQLQHYAGVGVIMIPNWKRQGGQAMLETMVVIGLLLFVMVGFGYLASALMDHGYRSLRLITLNIN